MSTRRITSHDVAKLAGVSRTTVSFVLNDVPGIQISDETRQRVLDAAEELNYVPNAAAQALARRRSQIIGLAIIRGAHQVSTDAFLNQMLNGLIMAVQENNLRLLLDITAPEHQEQAYLQLVRAKRIDGLILAGPTLNDVALLGLAEQNFPTVLIGNLPNIPFPSVDVDNRSAAKQAVTHLVRLGHRQIGCITNASHLYHSAIERLAGYRQALEAANIPYNETLIRYGDFDPKSGYQQMQSLLEVSPPISAVFISSDVVAMGAISAIRKHGLRIPEDIAIVGYDDVPLACYLSPPLTTVHLPAADLGYQAVDALIRVIHRQSLEQHHLQLPTQLIIRDSCGGKAKISD